MKTTKTKKTTDPLQPKAPGPFETIKRLSETKLTSFKDLENEGLYYDTFLINRAFSYHPDTLLIATLLNERSFLDKETQANFLISTVKPKKRYGKWGKTVDDENIQVIADYYGFSLREAKLHVGLHSPEQMAQMKEFVKDGKCLRVNS